MPSEGVMILGALAAFFFCLALGAAGLKIYFARKVAEEEEENAIASSTWSASPGPSPAPAPAPAFAPAPAPTTTSTYVAEPTTAAWKFNPDGYEETD